MKKKNLLMMFVMAMAIMLCPSIKSEASVTAITDYNTGVAVSGITPADRTTQAQLDNTDVYQVSVANDGTSYIKGVVPVTLTKSGYFMFAATAGNDISLSYALYADAECNTVIRSGLTNGSGVYVGAGTYYLGLSAYGPSIAGYNAGVATQFIPAATSLKSGSKKVIALNSTKDTYVKVKVNNTGSVNVKYAAKYGSYVSLCNSKKSQISTKPYLGSTGETNFAVKKGTYYLKFKASADYAIVQYKNTKISEKSGSSKKRAKAIKAGKTVKGVFLPTESTKKADWYKVTLTKKQALKLQLKSSCGGSGDSFQFQITPAKGLNVRGTFQKNLYSVNQTYTTKITSTLSSSLPKGTYYIKVTKNSKKNSGSYSIKFLK
ncbi:hypothetical protein lbkm_1127 [Lachnospiraceae bacterium KM106-2]|nr:hypothetical protein lbkm_1127 [Lachnospiraceae bacterium KM106-2]